MLVEKNTDKTNADEPVCSSQLDPPAFRAAVKQAYFELDQHLRSLVKDESGCVCVSFFFQ